MLDIKFIRENKELVKKSVEAKKADVDLDKLLKLDEKRKKLIGETDDINRKRNLIAHGGLDKNNPLLTEGKELRYKLYSSVNALKEIEGELDKLMYQVPNIPLESVPIGDETHKKVLRKVGEPIKFMFTPKDHTELGEILDIIDIQRATKVSGNRFAYLKNQGVLLEFALIQFALEILLKEGFVPVIPPAIIKKEITDGLGYWQGKINGDLTANENYYLVYDPKEEKPTENPEMYLIGTSEHALVPMHSGEILEKKDLPKRYAAFSPCFRREAGSYGKDTRGILRVHQFDKVEMVAFVKPEDDEKERKNMLNIAENLMKSLKLPYQVVKLASEDLGFPSAETIDIETWIPSQGRYRETHSISTTTDFQARRLNIRYREASETKYVHILNGTAFAIGRTLIAIMENYQQADGTVTVPEVLRKYAGFDRIEKK